MRWVVLGVGVVLFFLARRAPDGFKVAGRVIGIVLVLLAIIAITVPRTDDNQPSSIAHGSPAQPEQSTASVKQEPQASAPPFDFTSFYNEVLAIDKIYLGALVRRKSMDRRTEQQLQGSALLRYVSSREDLRLYNEADRRARALIQRLDDIPGVLLPDNPIFNCRRAMIYLQIGRMHEWLAGETSGKQSDLEAAQSEIAESQRSMANCKRAAEM